MRVDDVVIDMTHQEHNNNKCYTLTFRYVYIYIYIDKRYKFNYKCALSKFDQILF